MLRLTTFGSCFLERDGTRLEGVSGQRKGLGLLALLAVNDAGLSRESVAAYLWPESDEARAAASLKQLVHSLRQQLGLTDVILGPATLRLNPAIITSDVAEFRDALARADATAAVGLYGGAFLDGFLLREADSFERWVASTRSILAAQHAEALEMLAEEATARGDARGAVGWWRRRQAADPLSGRVAAGLMRALDAAGDRAGALRHAQIHAALLREELGPSATDPLVTDLAATLTRDISPQRRTLDAEERLPSRAAGEVISNDRVVATAEADVVPQLLAPTAETTTNSVRRPGWQTLAMIGVLAIVAIGSYLALQGDSAANTSANAFPGGAAAVPTDNAASVAVLPFANTSGDAADEPFADGLTDELIAALGHVEGLKVAPRTSTFALKGKGLDLRTIADTLGVATALEGSVRRSGEQLRINVSLVNAAENRVIWSRTYDRKFEDVFAVQQEIARDVVQSLQLAIAPTTSVLPPTADLVAYELFLKGQYFRYQLNRDALERAIRFFEQAIERDPRYAQAYSGLADAHALLVLFGDEPPREGFQRARAAATRALELDSTLAHAHASLGHVETAHDWNWPAAGAKYERALALDPTSTTIRLWRSLWLFDQRRFDEAVPVLEQTLAADPLSTPVRLTLGRLYVSKHEPDRAIRYLRETIELNPRLPLAHQQLGYALLQTNKPEEAIKEFAAAAGLSGVRDSAQLAYAYAVTGKRSEAQRIVNALVESAKRRYVSPFDVAIAYVGLGDTDAAFRWLEQAYEEHAAGMDAIAITTAFEPLYGDARWGRLLRRMGLSP